MPVGKACVFFYVAASKKQVETRRHNYSAHMEKRQEKKETIFDDSQDLPSAFGVLQKIDRKEMK